MSRQQNEGYIQSPSPLYNTAFVDIATSSFFLSFFLSFLFSSSFFSTCLFSSMNIEILDIYYSIFILAAVESNPSHHMQQFTFHLLRHGHIHTLSYTSSIVHVNPLELNRLVFLTSLSLASPRLRVLLCSL